MGNKKTFTIILVLCGVIQGAIESYFRISAKQSALTNDYDPKVIGMLNVLVTYDKKHVRQKYFCFLDWLIVTSGICQGIFAILVAYWGNRIHRTGWLGGLFMIQSFMCILVVIPTLVHK
jgi:hypothetical protein